MDRRDFLKKAAAGAAAAGIAGLGLPGGISAQDIIGGARDIAAMGPERRQGKFTIGYRPYELHLRHTFTVSGYSRTATPGVQLQISYDGVTGYGGGLRAKQYLLDLECTECTRIGQTQQLFMSQINNPQA